MSADDTIQATDPAGGTPTLLGGDDASASSSRRDRLSEELLEGIAGPTRLQHYVLLHRLGRGGTAVVYAAYDETLDRKVAIKLLRQGRRDGQSRLVREAKAMARLTDANVAQVYEIGETEGLIFIVMELVDGGTLGEWLAQRPRSRKEILAVFTAAGSGLRGAHAKGLVHRDFKPENVMLRSDGRPLVVDFGIAGIEEIDSPAELESGSLIATLGGTSSTLTRGRMPTDPVHKAVTGTPAYMAPEQFSRHPTDARTDQFSFCVALWGALYGQRPHEGDSVGELYLAVTRGQRTVPEHSDVPAWLRKVLERGLAVDPAERWPSMDALLAALNADPTRRKRWIVGSSAAGVLVLVGVAGLLLARAHARAERVATCQAEGAAIEADWSDDVRTRTERAFLATGLPFAGSAWEHTQQQMGAYAHEWSALREQTCLETHVEEQRSEQDHGEIVGCLDERRARFSGLVEAWAVVDERAITRATVGAASLPAPSTCTSERLRTRHLRPPEAQRAEVTALRARLERGAALNLAGNYSDALAEAQAVADAARVLAWRPLLAEALERVGDSYDNLGKYEEAREALWQASLEALGGGHDSVALSVAESMVLVVGDRLAQYEEGLQWGQRGMMLIERLELGGTIQEASLLGEIGSVQMRQGAYDEAFTSMSRALELQEAVLGSEHSNVATTLSSLGSVQMERGAYDEALAFQQRAMEIEQAVLGPDHPSIATLLNNMGNVRAKQGARGEALALYERALGIKEAALGSDHPLVASSLVNMGTELEYQGELERALASYQRAVSIWEATLGPDHPNVGVALNNIGSVQTKLGAHDEALKAARRGLAIFEAKLGPGHSTVGMLHSVIGTVQKNQGAYEDALASFRRSLEITEAALGPDHPRVADSHTSMGQASLELGRLDDALERFQRALGILEAALGPEHARLAGPLLGIGAVQVRRRAYGEARTVLERAHGIAERSAAPVLERARIQLQLARALWGGGEQERGRTLAITARDAMRTVDEGEGKIEDLELAEEWLREHP